MNQKLEYRIMLGYQAGILIGLLGAAIVVTISPMQLWIKIFSVIGLFSASLGTLWGLIGTYKQYKTFMELTKPVTAKEEIQNAGGNSIKTHD